MYFHHDHDHHHHHHHLIYRRQYYFIINHRLFLFFYSSTKSFFRFASMRALSELTVKPPPEPKPSTAPSAPLNSPPLCSLVRTTTECAPASVAALHVEFSFATKMTSKSTSSSLLIAVRMAASSATSPSKGRKTCSEPMTTSLLKFCLYKSPPTSGATILPFSSSYRALRVYTMRPRSCPPRRAFQRPATLTPALRAVRPFASSTRIKPLPLATRPFHQLTKLSRSDSSASNTRP